MQRPFLWILSCYLAGVLSAQVDPWPFVGWLVIAAGAGAGAILSRAHRSGWLGLMLLGCGGANHALVTGILSPHDLRELLREEPAYVRLRGKLDGNPKERRFDGNAGESSVRSTFVIRAIAWEREGEDWEPAFGRILVSAAGSADSRLYSGAILEATGILAPPDGPAAPGLFDYRRHLSQRGIYYQLAVESVDEVEVLEEGRLISRLLVGFQHWARETMAQGLPAVDREVELLWAMALGWKEGLTDEVSEPFRRSGTLHVFAISGLHVGLIAGILVSLLRTLRVPRGVCGMLVIPLLWAYAGVTGWPASAVRASVMASVVLAGWSLRRPSDLLNSLAAAAWLILLWEPRQLFQAGFQLSFAVVFTLALVLPRMEIWRRLLDRRDRYLPPEFESRWHRAYSTAVQLIGVNLAVSLSAWSGSLPLVAHYFHLLAPLGILANLVVVPLSGLALSSVLGSILTGAWFPALSEVFNHGAWFWMKCMVEVTRRCAEAPGAAYYVPSPDYWHMAGYYVMLGSLAGGWISDRRRLCWWAVALCGLALAGCIQWVVGRSRVSLTVLPAGGDAIVVNASGSLQDLVIDCGNERTADRVIIPFLKSRGINRLPPLVLTHGDAAHIGGFNALSNTFALRHLITSGHSFRSTLYRNIVEAAPHSFPKWTQVSRGDRAGPFTVFHPAETDTFTRADDGTIVLLGVIEGVRLLLLSDLGRQGQRVLLNRDPQLRVEIIIAGIPAANEMLTDSFLRSMQAELLIVSSSLFPVDARPSASLRRRLDRLPLKLFYTSDHGGLTLTLRNRRWTVTGPLGELLAQDL